MYIINEKLKNYKLAIIQNIYKRIEFGGIWDVKTILLFCFPLMLDAAFLSCTKRVMCGEVKWIVIMILNCLRALQMEKGY